MRSRTSGAALSGTQPTRRSRDYFTLTGYTSNPRPVQEPNPTIVYATSSEGGYKVVADQCDEAFIQCTPGKNEKRYLAGALNNRTGRLTWVEGERKTSALFIALVDHLAIIGEHLWHSVLASYFVGALTVTPTDRCQTHFFVTH